MASSMNSRAYGGGQEHISFATPTLMVPVIIVGGILGGVFTPAEAGAVAVLYAILLGFSIIESSMARSCAVRCWRRSGSRPRR